MKDDRQLDSLVNTVRVFSTGIGIWRSYLEEEKSEGITLPDNCKMKSVEGDDLKCLEILEYDDLLHGCMKKGLKKEYFRKLIKRKSSSQNLMGKNTLQSIHGLCQL